MKKTKAGKKPEIIGFHLHKWTKWYMRYDEEGHLNNERYCVKCNKLWRELV